MSSFELRQSKIQLNFRFLWYCQVPGVWLSAVDRALRVKLSVSADCSLFAALLDNGNLVVAAS